MSKSTPRLARSRAAGPLIGAWLSIPHPIVAEATAAESVDFVCIDVEHTPASLETVTAMCRAVNAAPGDTEILVRAGSHDPSTLGRLADAGPDAILVPMVNDSEEAAAVVDATRYPPAGSRGLGLSRGTAYGQRLAETVRDDGPIARLLQIETLRGVENAESIADVEGVDGLFVGPVDLSAAMDRLGDWEDAEFLAAVESIHSAAHGSGIGVGSLATTAEERETRLGEWGVDYLAAGIDLHGVVNHIGDAAEHCRTLRAEHN